LRCAAIDVGTNTTRLLIAEKKGGKLQETCRDLATTRLGSGLRRTGKLSAAGKVATVAAVRDFAAKARRRECDFVRIVATSAMREAMDGPDFARELEAAAGLQVEILPPDVEAWYSYLGVTKSLVTNRQTLIFDLGGGSCELLWEEKNGLQTLSFPLGALYLTDAYLQHDPPLAEEVAAARKHIRRCLYGCVPPAVKLVGVGGTVTSLAAVVKQLPLYDPAQIHGFYLEKRLVEEKLQLLLQLREAERALLPGMQPERARILPAGVLVVDELLLAANAPGFTVSEGDLLLGALYAVILPASALPRPPGE
jgi:exopolyphosphatase/guanosine-5'-triphosphate,3'-diphosphate pyrophosphatase